MRLLRTLLVLALTLVTAGALTSAATAGTQLHKRQTGPSENRVTWSAAGTYVLGDSISAYGSDELAARRPRWEINAVHGRLVTTLPALVANVRAVDKRPFRVIIELGSNQARSWTKADYLDAIAQLPSSTRVLLVTPYKAPGHRWTKRAVKTVTRYASWMQQIARSRPHTCVVPWRARAKAHPDWLRDGLHPLQAHYADWADLIVTTDSTCH
jgi:hypothetical protein